MFCHIISQIIKRDNVVMQFAYEKCSSMDYLDLPTLNTLALDCLLSSRDTTIVLDGLDEGNEPDRVIRWCLDELLGTVSSHGCHVRLLICGQEDGRIEPLLSPYPQIRLHTVDFHHMDIQEYCKTKASAIATRFRLSLDDQMTLTLKVKAASNGMFKSLARWTFKAMRLKPTPRNVSLHKGSTSKSRINGFQERVQNRIGKQSISTQPR